MPTDQSSDLDLIEVINSEPNDRNTNDQLSDLNTYHKKSNSCIFCKFKLPCLVLTTVLFVILILLFKFLHGKRSEHDSARNTMNISDNEWSFDLSSYESDSSIKLIDIDEDGLDDILFGVTGILKNSTF